MNTRIWVLIIGMAAGLQVLMGCTAQPSGTRSASSPGAAGEQSPAPTSVPTSARSLVPTSIESANSVGQPTEGGTFHNLLGAIPDLPETRKQVVVNDYRRFREVYGVLVPAAEASEGDLEAYFTSIYGDPHRGMRAGSAFISGIDQFSTSPIRRGNLGFGPQDVDADLWAGDPPLEFEVAAGRIEPLAVDQALDQCKACPSIAHERYVRATYRGATVHSWGDGQAISIEARWKPPAYDNFGRARPIAVQPSLVLRATEFERLELMLDVRQGAMAHFEGREVASLAHSAEYRLLADGLEVLKPYSALLVGQTQFTSEEAANAVARLPVLKQAPMLQPYQAFASGIGRDDTGVFMALVMVHETTQAAAANVDLLRQRVERTPSLSREVPWNSLLAESDIRVDGRLLLAKLRGPSAHLVWIELVTERDPLLLHE